MDKEQKEQRLKLVRQAYAKVQARRTRKKNGQPGELLRDKGQRHDEMKAEASGEWDPAPESAETEENSHAPGCSWRRPAPSSDEYNGEDKVLVEGARSVDLDAASQPPPDVVLEDRRREEITKLVIESYRDETGSEGHDEDETKSDELPEPAIPGSSRRNPTGKKRSTSLDQDPRADPNPEEVLSEKEQKFLKGEDQD